MAPADALAAILSPLALAVQFTCTGTCIGTGIALHWEGPLANVAPTPAGLSSTSALDSQLRKSASTHFKVSSDTNQLFGCAIPEMSPTHRALRVVCAALKAPSANLAPMPLSALSLAAPIKIFSPKNLPFNVQSLNRLKIWKYKMRPSNPATLANTIIPFGKGICGQVAVNNQNFVVPDVQVQDNYIACSLTVKSEIVIPIFVNGENIGQIDIDSNNLNPFTKADEVFLEFVCTKVASIL